MLTDRQARFATEYLVDLNATQAAIRAGYSPRTAASQGQRLLKNVEVQTLVQAGQADRKKRVELSQDWVIDKLRVLAEDGDVRALELIGKHLGMWPKKLQVTLPEAPFKLYAGFDPDQV